MPPDLLFTGCHHAADTGGECVLVDGRAIYDDLARTAPEALQALRTPRSVFFGGPTGHLGSVFTDLDRQRVTVRLRLDDLAWFSPSVSCWLPVLRSVIDRHAITLPLAAGEGYVLNNRRWLHGRCAFTGRRVMFRLLGNPLPHVVLPAGWAYVGQNVA